MIKASTWADKNAAILRARELRRNMTPPERRLWQVLRSRPGGYKFRKQHPFGPYTADFYCPSARLVIEVDGDGHDMGDRPERDFDRDEQLRQQGLHVVRFLAVEVMKNLEGVIAAILLAARR